MGLKLKYHSSAVLYPIDLAHPEESEYEVISDITGDDITGEELWDVDGNICSRDEMLYIFYRDYVTEIKDKDEYEKAKNYLKTEFGWTDDMFGKNKLLKIKQGDGYTYDDDDFDIYEYLPDDWCQVDESDLEVDDDYEPDYDDQWED